MSSVGYAISVSKSCRTSSRAATHQPIGFKAPPLAPPEYSTARAPSSSRSGSGRPRQTVEEMEMPHHVRSGLQMSKRHHPGRTAPPHSTFDQIAWNLMRVEVLDLDHSVAKRSNETMVLRLTTETAF